METLLNMDDLGFFPLFLVQHPDVSSLFPNGFLPSETPLAQPGYRLPAA